MTIRRAEQKDLNQLVKIFDEYRVWYRKEPDLVGAETFLSDRISKKESVIFIAENEDKSLAGFTQCYPLFSSTRMKRLWLLNDLFVAPTDRGKGVSKMLIDAAKELCRETDACALALETEKSNTIGNILYPKSGFEMNTEHNFYEWSV